MQSYVQECYYLDGSKIYRSGLAWFSMAMVQYGTIVEPSVFASVSTQLRREQWTGLMNECC